AMLCEVGAITVPADVLERASRGDALSADEGDMIDSARDVPQQLISHIPRIDAVRMILREQRLPFDGAGSQVDAPRGEAISIGARVLLVANDFDHLESRGDS